MRLLSKGSKLYSIFFNKCPKCHVGCFWLRKNPFVNIFLNNNNTKCKNCSLLYELEIGFWYGSMYISYAISVAVMLFFWTLTTVFLPLINILNEILIISLAIIIISPLNYHFSRLIWINFFIKYIPNDKKRMKSC